MHWGLNLSYRSLALEGDHAVPFRVICVICGPMSCYKFESAVGVDEAITLGGSGVKSSPGLMN